MSRSFVRERLVERRAEIPSIRMYILRVFLYAELVTSADGGAMHMCCPDLIGRESWDREEAVGDVDKNSPPM